MVLTTSNFVYKPKKELTIHICFLISCAVSRAMLQGAVYNALNECKKFKHLSGKDFKQFEQADRVSKLQHQTKHTHPYRLEKKNSYHLVQNIRV